ncbi:MAG: MoaD/ThiS family protein [Tepidanaerobacteraceae bacterium]
MIKVKAMVVLDLVNLLHEREITFSLEKGTTIRGFLEIMFSKYGPRLEERIYADKEKDILNLNLYLNGKHIIFLDGLDTVIQDKDTLLFIPFAAGG